MASKKEKLAILAKGVTLGKQAIELYPKKTDGHYWYAISLGREAELKGILQYANRFGIKIIGAASKENSMLLKAPAAKRIFGLVATPVSSKSPKKK